MNANNNRQHQKVAAMFQEAFQKKLIIISCLLMAIAGFVAGTQMKSFRSAKVKAAQVDIAALFQNDS